ncbi:MAG: hypothetical protein KIT27_09645 [Legionellales bacterium]|nr:hypothetical protein [Legionellales bacterium]
MALSFVKIRHDFEDLRRRFVGNGHDGLEKYVFPETINIGSDFQLVPANITYSHTQDVECINAFSSFSSFNGRMSYQEFLEARKKAQMSALNSQMRDSFTITQTGHKKQLSLYWPQNNNDKLYKTCLAFNLFNFIEMVIYQAWVCDNISYLLKVYQDFQNESDITKLIKIRDDLKAKSEKLVNVHSLKISELFYTKISELSFGIRISQGLFDIANKKTAIVPHNPPSTSAETFFPEINDSPQNLQNLTGFQIFYYFLWKARYSYVGYKKGFQNTFVNPILLAPKSETDSQLRIESGFNALIQGINKIEEFNPQSQPNWDNIQDLSMNTLLVSVNAKISQLEAQQKAEEAAKIANSGGDAVMQNQPAVIEYGVIITGIKEIHQGKKASCCLWPFWRSGLDSRTLSSDADDVKLKAIIKYGLYGNKAESYTGKRTRDSIKEYLTKTKQLDIKVVDDLLNTANSPSESSESEEAKVNAVFQTLITSTSAT